ncbi:MAG: hypothetical protein HFJ19_05200 [Clostridia bacterium]|nr:hypothetical protein [Clostridia bacterium]
MKKIYIVLTHTGTLLSRIIKKYTKDEFSHVSISLDVDLKEMYSFGRLNPYNALWGGFIHEYIDKGTFKRFYKTKAKIYSLEITEEQYEDVKSNIERIKRDKKDYKFNMLGLLAVGIHKKIKKEHSFYCAEFIKYVLENAGIKTELPEIVRPEDFKNIYGLQEIYSGLLRKYQVPKIDVKKLLRDVCIQKKERVI